MNILFYLIIGLFLLFMMKQILPEKGIYQITTTELKSELSNKDKQFIDVRTPGEFNRNHIKTFKNIPLNNLNGMAEDKLSKEKEVIVICQSGMRSMRASKMLKKLGYKHVTNVKGGMSAWL